MQCTNKLIIFYSYKGGKSDASKVSLYTQMWFMAHAQQRRSLSTSDREFAAIVVLGFRYFTQAKNCKNVCCLFNCMPRKKINPGQKMSQHYATKNTKQSIYCFKPLRGHWFSRVWDPYPAAGCTHHFPSWGGGRQAPQTLAFQGLELLLALLVAEQLLHVISVQLVFPISLICRPDVVLSYHAVLGKCLPVEIAHSGAPTPPFAHKAPAM